MKTCLLLLMFGASLSAQTADKSFWTVTTGAAAFTALDAFATITEVGHSRTCPYEVSSPELYGREPQALRTGTVMGGLFAASVGVSYLLKRKRLGKVPLWPTPESYLAYGHAVGAIHNFRHC